MEGDLLHIEILSMSCADVIKSQHSNATNQNCNRSSILINGSEYSMDITGYNFAILDPATGNVRDTQHFQTQLDPTSGFRLADYLKNHVPDESIVCVAGKPDGSRYIKGAIKELHKIGASTPMEISPGSTFALLGYKGNDSMSWVTHVQRAKGMGPSKINKYLPLPKLPCVDVKLISQGCKDPGIDKYNGTCGKAFIYVNGVQSAVQKKGYNIVAVDYLTGQVLNSSSFDISSDPLSGIIACTKLSDFIQALPNNTIVLISVQNTASRFFTMDLYRALKSIGTRLTLRSEHQSFTLIGYKGKRSVNWVREKQNTASKGPTELSARILLPFNHTKSNSSRIRTTPTIATKYPRQENCGIPDMGLTRVVGGINAKRGAWPWQAGIYFRIINRLQCGAALINSNWLVTTAQCVPSTRSQDFYVVLGDNNRSLSEGSEQIYNITKIIPHPRYFSGGLYNNDIALIQLSRPVLLTKYVKPICLPPPFQVVSENTTCMMTGWGKTHMFGSYANLLQQAKVAIRPLSTCQRKVSASRYASLLNMTHSMMCLSGKLNDVVSGCHGDSGGPVVCRSSAGRYVLQGILSWGSPMCKSKELYTVGTKVTMYRDWIERTLSEYDEKTIDTTTAIPNTLSSSTNSSR